MEQEVSVILDLTGYHYLCLWLAALKGCRVSLGEHACKTIDFFNIHKVRYGSWILTKKRPYFCTMNVFLPFPSLTGLTFLDLHQYWVKPTWPLCPYVDEWLPHTHFVRFWCSGVDSVTLTRKVCDPSALKAVWPQLRPGKSSSLYGASTPSKILHPVCCDLVRSNEWLLLLPLYSEEEKKKKKEKTLDLY